VRMAQYITGAELPTIHYCTPVTQVIDLFLCYC
jgi:hypothetical protein